jgi:asparagine synthase (glutamine-hydrolysing)
MAGRVSAQSAAWLDALAGSTVGRLSGRSALRYPGDKLSKAASVLTASDQDGLYRRLVSLWKEPAELTGTVEPRSRFDDESVRALVPDFFARMMFLDQVTYLPDDILVKVDRASMAVSLEVRAPLLDHRVAEFAWSLPMGMKRRHGLGKWLLRQVLYRHVPPAMVDRPKMGFAVPIREWLRGELRDWAESLLAPERLAREGWLAPGPVAALWRDHLGGQRHEHYRLWAVLTFQSWLAASRDSG